MAPPTYTLYTPAGSFRAFAPLIAAEVNEIDVTVVTDDTILHRVAAAQSPTGKLPLLDTPDHHQSIFSSLAMARYLAGLRPDTALLGGTMQEQMQVDYWMDWTVQEVEIPACVLFYPKLGYMQENKQATAKAKQDLAAALKVLEDHLTSNTDSLWLVGGHWTLADIVLASTLLYPFQLVCNEEFIQPYAKVVEWFQKCVQQPSFLGVVGPVQLLAETPAAKETPACIAATPKIPAPSTESTDTASTTTATEPAIAVASTALEVPRDGKIQTL